MPESELVLDTDLPLFTPDVTAASIPATHPELAIATAASSRPVWLHGARATLSGDVRGGAREIRMDGRLVVSDLVAEAGPVANAVVSPGLMRRERLSARGSGQESILVSPSLPLVACTFQGARPPRVTLVVFPDSGRTRYRVQGGTVTLRPEGSDLLLVAAASPASVGWMVRPAPGGGAVLEATSAPGASAEEEGVGSLVLACGSEPAVRTAVSGARHLTGHAIKAGSPVGGDLLALHSAAVGLDHAVQWMEHRLAAGIRGADRTTTGSPPEAWLWAGLGACAVGDVDGTGTCIRALDEMGRPDEALLLASRLALATGRQEGVMDRVLAADTLSTPPEGSSAMRRLALRTASDALRYAAPEQLVRDLRAAGAPEVTPRPGRRLPTVGSPGTPPTPSPALAGDQGVTLGYLLEGPAQGAPPVPVHGGGPALEAWTSLVAGHPEAWARWRALAAEGLEGSERGIGAWEAFHSDRPPATTGILLAAMAHGWLGVHPDAPVGRLSLAPRVPGHVTAFGVRGLRVGDASLDLAYARDGSVHRFELVPTGGRVPPLVVFQPVVPASGVERVVVDGEPADVDAVDVGGGTGVRLQTPVDARRVVEIQAR